MAEAGYGNGFKTTIYTPNWGSFFPTPAVAIQPYLKKIGIDMQIQPLGMVAHRTAQEAWKSSLCVLGGAMALPDITRNLMSDFSAQSPMKNSILFPADYNDALANAGKASDFESKKKWTWEVQKLLVDKYDLANIFFTQVRLFASSKRVHDSGIGTSVYTQWEPDNAWLDQ